MIESRVQLSDETFMLKRKRNYTYFKGFPFLLERKRNHIEYFHCIQRYASQCKARLVIKRFSDGNDRIMQLKEHNHELKAGESWNFDFFAKFIHFQSHTKQSIFLANTLASNCHFR